MRALFAGEFRGGVTRHQNPSPKNPSLRLDFFDPPSRGGWIPLIDFTQSLAALKRQRLDQCTGVGGRRAYRAADEQIAAGGYFLSRGVLVR